MVKSEGDTMSIVADRIEQFILKKLVEEQQKMLVLQRNELADELECAPSQISYVLSTRFSKRPGFIVESRRGLGGHIRIMQISGEEPPAMQPEYTIGSIDQILHQGIGLKRITKREAQILHEACQLLLDTLPENKRSGAVHHLLEFTKEITEPKHRSRGGGNEKR